MENKFNITTRKDALILGLKRFFTGKECKKGHISEILVSSYECCECNRIKANNFYKNNHEKCLIRNAEYRAKPESLDSMRKYLSEYRSKPENKEARKKWHKDKYENDEVYAIAKRARNLVSDAINRSGFKKNSATEKILQCTIPQFKLHIERQFTDGMSWSNRDKWELDHIIPISTAKTEYDAISLNCHTNIRPLWKKTNREKSDSIIFLI